MATEVSDFKKVEFPTHERPHTEVPTMVMIGGALAFVAIFCAILYVGPNWFVRDLILGNRKGEHTFNIERLIFQGTTLFVWALSTLNIILKISRIKKEKQMIGEIQLPDNLDFTNEDELISVYERIKSNPNLTNSLGLTRVARVLAMWINTRDFERTAEYAREQAGLDAVASDSSYRKNRLFIWAMPLLGFVGTVFGVAAGIGGFAEFLAGAGVTAEGIKVQVGHITEGLAVAFYCTLLGLLTAGMAAFPSLGAERKEEEVLAEIDELVEDRLLSRMPSGGGGGGGGGGPVGKFPVEELTNAIREGLSGLEAQTKFPVEELAQAIDAGFRRLPNPDRYEEVFTRAVTKAADAINQKYEEFQTNYERRVSELGSQLGGKLEGVAGNFNSGAAKMMDEFRKTQEKNLEVFARNEQKLAEKFEELTEQIATLGKEQNEAMSDAHDKYVEAVQELDRKEIQRWEKMVSDFNQLSVRLSENFTKSVQALDSASQRYSEQIRNSAQALVDQLEAVTKLGNEIDKVLRTTQSMESTLRQVGSSEEFRQTLANIRSHLNTSDELLKQLSKPRKVVFQEARADESL